MPLITLRETITKKIEIPMETLYELIENLTRKERELWWTPKFGQCAKLHLGAKTRRTKWRI